MFDSPLLMEPQAAQRLAEALRSPQALGVAPRRTRPAGFERVGDVAVVSVEGPLARKPLSAWFESADYPGIAAAARAAAEDKTVAGILLRVDSPGGESAGIAEAAEAIAAARRVKPTVAIISGIGASAAYWLASQAGRVFASDPTALVGSIGTYIGLYDMSGAAQKAGVRPVVIRTGQFKAAGFPGTEVTAEQQAYWQQIVDQTQALFDAAVAAGRGLPLAAVRELADGRVHTAADAIKLRLIDGIQPLDRTLAQLQRGKTMNDGPASLSELKAALPRASAEFLLSQLEASATVAAAREAWLDQREAELDRRAAGRPGVEPLREVAPRRARAEAEADGDFLGMVNELVAKGTPRLAAVARVAKSRPDLHREYVESRNASTPRVQALIAERFAQ